MTATPATPEQSPTTEHDSVIPTGWLTAYARSFSDIPYANDIFEVFEENKAGSPDQPIVEKMKATNMAPHFEARYRLIDRLIAKTGIKQVLEVAAGLSTRGLIMGQVGFSFTDVDLPKMNIDKRSAIKRLGTAIGSNYHIEDGDALDLGSLMHATSHFDDSKPIVVLNEGLMRYLNFDEKTRYVDNVRQLLRKFGGVWITSDISLPKVLDDHKEAMSGHRKSILNITGRDIKKNLFKDVDDAMHYFSGLGFDVESHSLLEVSDELTSSKKLGLTKDYVETINRSTVVFVMKLRNED